MVVWGKLLGNLAFSFLLCAVAVDGRPSKRSPLELGFVTFPEAEKPKPSTPSNGTGAETGPEKNRRIFDHEWIPGKVRHHAFIPAHVHHLYLPIVFSRAVLVKSDLYRSAYGGYGVGTLSGGRGAGHGFQIVFHDDVE